jgi:hypothetical protein
MAKLGSGACALAGALGLVALSACASGASRTHAAAPAGAAVVTTSTGSSSSSSSSVPTKPAVATTTTTLDPGLLAQTHALPSANDPVFQSHVRALWTAIVTDNPALAMPSFFPRSAYLQVKAMISPGADYQNRLLAWFDLDIRAAHALLGAQADDATFQQVEVPASAGVWVLPGVEYNRVGYYRVYGSRLIYELEGSIRSLGIFSLISWRGEWYVVHLGPSTRSTTRGIVYQPRP